VRATLDGLPADRDVAARPSSVRVTWRFHAGDGEAHVFGLAYRVAGAFRKEAGADVLKWRVLPERHEYDIREGQVEFIASLALPVVPHVTYAVNVAHAGNRSVFHLPSFGPNQSTMLWAEFPPGFARQSRWQVEQREREVHVGAAWRAGALAALAALLAGFWGVWRFDSAARSRVQVLPETGDVREPPGSLSPAVVERIMESCPTSHAPLSTLLDLARRGLVRVRRRETAAFGPRGTRWNAGARGAVCCRLKPCCSMPGSDGSKPSNFPRF